MRLKSLFLFPEPFLVLFSKSPMLVSSRALPVPSSFPRAPCWQLLCSLLLGAGNIPLLESEMLEIRAMHWKAPGTVGLIPFSAHWALPLPSPRFHCSGEVPAVLKLCPHGRLWAGLAALLRWRKGFHWLSIDSVQRRVFVFPFAQCLVPSRIPQLRGRQEKPQHQGSDTVWVELWQGGAASALAPRQNTLRLFGGQL